MLSGVLGVGWVRLPLPAAPRRLSGGSPAALRRRGLGLCRRRGVPAGPPPAARSRGPPAAPSPGPRGAASGGGPSAASRGPRGAASGGGPSAASPGPRRRGVLWRWPRVGPSAGFFRAPAASSGGAPGGAASPRRPAAASPGLRRRGLPRPPAARPPAAPPVHLLHRQRASGGAGRPRTAGPFIFCCAGEAEDEPLALTAPCWLLLAHTIRAIDGSPREPPRSSHTLARAAREARP
jgi:hypothetical protein